MENLQVTIETGKLQGIHGCCLLYTSDAADDLLCVDLGGRRIIKKKKIKETGSVTTIKEESTNKNNRKDKARENTKRPKIQTRMQ